MSHDRPAVSDDFDEWAALLAHQHRFGSQDGRGSLNLIGRVARVRAARAIVRGETASLGRTVVPGRTLRRDSQPSFTLDSYLRPGPDGAAIASDRMQIDCHGSANTHIDALNHMGFAGSWYGGHRIGDSVPAVPSVADLARGGIFTRAVYVNVCALLGKDWPEVDDVIRSDDLDAALAAADVTVESGDALLLDMGRDRLEQSGRSVSMSGPSPGPGRDVAEWISRHDVGLLCWDLLDASRPTEPIGPIHRLTWAIGLILIDNCTFAGCRRLYAGASVGVGALAVGALPVEGATGCLVNPVLIA